MKYLIVLIFQVFLFSFYSQKTSEIYSDVWGIEGRIKSGFLLAHRGVMAHIPTQMAYCGEVSLYRKPSGNKKWHSSYKHPQHGITLIAGSAGNNEVLGYFFGSYGYIELPIIKKNNFQLDWKLGIGLAYSTKKYDPISNPKNAAIGSNLNALSCFGARASYFFKKQKLTLGLDMTHYSNGSFNVPNLGVNIPFLSIGYGHDICEKVKDTAFIKSSYANNNWNFGIITIYSAKQINTMNDNRYSVFALDLFSRRIFSPKAGLELAVNLMSNQSLGENDTEEEISQADIFQAGVFAGYIMPLDKFHFVFGMGAYIKNKLMPRDPIYHRIGVRYIFDNGLTGHFVLKSHYARADYFELGIGYTFNFIKR